MDETEMLRKLAGIRDRTEADKDLLPYLRKTTFQYNEPDAQLDSSHTYRIWDIKRDEPKGEESSGRIRGLIVEDLSSAKGKKFIRVSPEILSKVHDVKRQK